MTQIKLKKKTSAKGEPFPKFVKGSTVCEQHAFIQSSITRHQTVTFHYIPSLQTLVPNLDHHPKAKFSTKM